MRKIVVAAALGAALLAPPLGATSAAADTGSSGCTSTQPPRCTDPFAYVFVTLLDAVNTGSASTP